MTTQKPARVSGIREYKEDVRSITGRARNMPEPSATGFKLLTAQEQAELLINLSFLERWAREMKRRIVSETEQKDGSQ